MSWLFGIISRSISESEAARAAATYNHPDHLIRQPGVLIAAGGLPETSLRGFFPLNKDAGWIMLGTGLRRENDHVVRVTEKEWTERLAEPVPRVADLDGHFAAIIWKEDGIRCLVDSLGLRVLYYSSEPERVVVSTRLDWLARFGGRSDVDVAVFGSAWMTFHQLSSACPVRGLHKLGQGGQLFVGGDTNVTVSSVPFQPKRSPSSPTHAQLLRAYCTPTFVPRERISLGLSGGVDSRLLLSVLNPSGDTPLRAHTFGDRGDPDVQMATEISGALGIELLHLDSPVPAAEQCLKLSRELQAHLCVTEPASSVLKLGHYAALRSKGRVMTDGGFGEIGRRQYFNRLLHFGRRALLRGDPAGILPYITVRRRKFFAAEVADAMRAGTIVQLETLLSTMPPIAEVGIENWLDLLAIRTRIPNFGGPEQSRLDGILVNYMPLVQPSLVHHLFSMDVAERRNGQWARKYIRESVPVLATFPLVKSGTTYPFRLAGMAASVWTQARRRPGRSYHNPASSALLHRLSEFVQDTVNSTAVATSPLYDYRYLLRLVTDFYRGHQKNGTELDWWLAFELWRQSLR